MECAQLNIAGGGSTQPTTYSIPGIYAGSDPGITIDIYQTLENYTIPGRFSSVMRRQGVLTVFLPGPPVFAC